MSKFLPGTFTERELEIDDIRLLPKRMVLQRRFSIVEVARTARAQLVAINRTAKHCDARYTHSSSQVLFRRREWRPPLSSKRPEFR